MNTTKLMAAAAAGTLALISTAPALAGPAGEGRGFTVEQMHKQVAARTVKVASANTGCLSTVAAELKSRADVHSTAVRSGEVHVTFVSADDAAQGEATVRDAVAKACA